MRSAKTGAGIESKMVKTRSEAIFIKDCVPFHTSKCNQKWCANQVSSVWDKDKCPGNSPEPNPIKHLLSILKQSLGKQVSDQPRSACEATKDSI